MENIPYGYVYRTVNLINGNTYIGQRRLRSDKNWYAYTGSGKLIKAAVKKYGRENFAKHFVGYAFTKSELDLLELEVMREEKRQGKAEYNLFVGAPSFPFHNTWGRLSEEDRQRNRANLSQRNKDLAAARYKTFVENHGEEALAMYLTERNVLRVAKNLGVSKGHVRRLLKERSVKLNHQNVIGRKLPFSTREKIRQAAIKNASKESDSVKARKAAGSELLKDTMNKSAKIKHCKECKIEFSSTRSQVMYCSNLCRQVGSNIANRVSGEELSEMVLVKRMNIAEICLALGCKKSTLYGLLKKHKLPTPTKILP